MNQKKIEELVPFNDIFYKVCFNNSFYPVVRFLGKSEIPFLINDVSVYHQEDKSDWKKFSCDYISKDCFEDMLEHQNILVKTNDNSLCVTEDICNAIDQGRPVILWVDCYFDPLRYDTFHKKHMVHTILIYGYNKDERIFHIIEHKYQYSLSYTKDVIRFSDLTNCYEGQLVNVYKCGVPNFNACDRKCGFPNNPEYRKKCGFLGYLNLKNRDYFPNYYEFYQGDCALEKKKSQHDFYLEYCENLVRKKEQILEGLHDLQNVTKQIIDLIQNQDELSENKEKLLELFNDITNAKLSERHKMMNLSYFDSKFVHSLDDIIECLHLIRNVIMRFMFSMVYDGDRIKETMEALEQFSALEMKYYRELFEFIKEQENYC